MATAFRPVYGDTKVIQEFSGVGTTTTGFFKVEDRWEVRWNARQVVSVAVMSSDGTIVAGAAGVLRGSLFVPQAGQYYLKITDGTTAASPSAKTNPPAASSPAPDESTVSWHLQVIELGKSVASDQALSVYTPFFMVPDAAVTPAALSPDQPAPVLSNDQIHSIVTIKGDTAQGIGFLMRSPDGVFVVTHLDLVAANPNLALLTNSGAPITILSFKGATDRDLALIAVKDDHFSALPVVSADANSIADQDQLIIPDIGQQSDVKQGVAGKVVGLGPERIDFDNTLGSGSNGAPVIQVKTGNVLAIVTPVKSTDISDNIAQAWPANPPPGSAGLIPYFGLRLTGIQGWETYDMAHFLSESLFLRQFHETTRCLDSYLNGRRHRGQNPAEGGGPPDNRYYLNNDKLHRISDAYKQSAIGADQEERLDATRSLLFDLQGVADTDVTVLQGANLLYVFDQTRAQEELAYRKALKKELDDLSNNIGRLDGIARSR